MALYECLDGNGDRVRGPVDFAEQPPDVSGKGWTWRVFTPPTPPAPSTTELKTYAAGARWQKETGGMTLPNGARIATDTAAQTKIAAAKDAFDNGTLTGTISFKTDSGFTDADAATVTAVYAAVVGHVQGCYVTERSVCDQIDSGTITTFAQIDEAFA